MGFRKNTVLFSCGGLAYMGLEVLWRGYSHSSMFLAGGSCFLLLGRLARRTDRLTVRALGSAGIITGVELVAGLLANRGYGVWDYRDMPLNFKGQICLPYTLMWMPVGLAGMALYNRLERLILGRNTINRV